MSFLYLASQSPRRREILQQIGVSYQLINVDVAECKTPDESVIAYMERLAREKARAGLAAVKHAGLSPGPVLGADTLGLLNNTLLEKPRDEADAVSMLMSMSGREHLVYSAVCLVDDQQCIVRRSETSVRFRAFSEAEAREYWQTGEPADKAGAYGIQGLGGALVEHISGSYSGVVGLPIETLVPMLKEFELRLWQPGTETR